MQQVGSAQSRDQGPYILSCHLWPQVALLIQLLIQAVSACLQSSKIVVQQSVVACVRHCVQAAAGTHWKQASRRRAAAGRCCMPRLSIRSSNVVQPACPGVLEPYAPVVLHSVMQVQVAGAP